MKQQQWQLYLLGNTKLGWYKIGVAINATQRRAELDKPKLPFPMAVICAIDAGTHSRARLIEHRLHKAYSANRLRGEWFRDIEPEDFKAKAAQFMCYQRPAWRVLYSRARKPSRAQQEHESNVLNLLQERGIDAAMAVRTEAFACQQIARTDAVSLAE